MYGAAFELKAALDYDFDMERKFKYSSLSKDEIVKLITFFVLRLWQIHAFGEENTRTTVVFTIKYLRSMGNKVENDIFAENSWYFRNALVRANYKNLKRGIPLVVIRSLNRLRNKHPEFRFIEFNQIRDSSFVSNGQN